jgi:hypothetical protein
MTDSLVPSKKVRKKVEKPSQAALAFRAYERVSMYLATQGDFDFKTDDLAREAFYNASPADIQFLTGQRSFGITIPKGDFIIPGLKMRTDRRMLMEKGISGAKKKGKAS